MLTDYESIVLLAEGCGCLLIAIGACAVIVWPKRRK